jgi:hypothetical protein
MRGSNAVMKGLEPLASGPFAWGGDAARGPEPQAAAGSAMGGL